ncbi:B12-binding domain-containing radical SAM protein [Bengtsoniella intestinalis]|uniref:B12-binding domain-containing radical SAM protein n=1 Tax=Bengtsoniella intestinalis TaxID=3073143 RepID=UPI00391EE304
MNALLVAINAKFIHTNLAVRNIYHCCKEQVPQNLDMVEFTINQRLPHIIDTLYRQKADILLFSCYIWNIEYVSQIIDTYHKIHPTAILLVGGPEVSYDPQEFLSCHPQVTAVVTGEGEGIVPAVLQTLADDGGLSSIAGLVYRQGDTLVETPVAPPFPMADIPFSYHDLQALSHRIVYFESSRGCPFRCSYCLSSIAGGVRFMPLEKVFAQLSIFLEHKVRQVKFVDRTFNCNKAHAMAIWQFLKDHDNGVTNFHFEIAAHLLDREMLDLLKTIRTEQFQLEVGVQSTNPRTIDQIKRATNTEQLLDICKEIDSYGNIHQHLDLIAGLPYEDISSFEESFNTVFAIRPQQLQLGFLKILKGSQMAQEVAEHHIVYNQHAPFEVLGTKWLTYDHILLLKGVEDMVERYYNSGRYQNTLRQLLENQPSAYRFFEDLGAYFFAQDYHLSPLSKEQVHTVLKDFYESHSGAYTPEIKASVLFDICLKEKPKKFPTWVDPQWSESQRRDMSQFFANPDNIDRYLPQYQGEHHSRVSRLAHLQVFDYDVTDPRLPCQTTHLLFDYDHPDLLGNATYYKVTL